ncbi:MAG TPA: hypothetical protein VEJ63_00090, partial [Planctomycetota bacterium]|nr:hypothetical protein [Planctomycetota bacterium]
MRLRAEGFDPSAVSRVVAEVFRENKEAVRAKRELYAEQIVTINQLIAGGKPPPLFRAAEYIDIAHEKRNMLERDRCRYRTYIFWNV